MKDLEIGQPGLDDRVVNLDQGPRLSPLHRSFALYAFVERGEGIEPLFLLHDREQAANLEVGLLVGVFELNEPGDRVRFPEALSIWWTRSLIRSVSAALATASAVFCRTVTTSDFSLCASALPVAARAPISSPASSTVFWTLSG